MASGYGTRGDRGRCYMFWSDFKECVRQFKDYTDAKPACQLQFDDYLECLHHRKAYAREQLIQQKREEKAAAEAAASRRHASAKKAESS